MITRGLSCDHFRFGYFLVGSDDPPTPKPGYRPALFALHVVANIQHMYDLYVSEISDTANRRVLLQPSTCGAIPIGLSRLRTYGRQLQCLMMRSFVRC